MGRRPEAIDAFDVVRPGSGAMTAARFHNEYLRTFNRPNATLVDAKGKGVERSNANGFYGGGPFEFFKIFEELCAAGDLPGL